MKYFSLFTGIGGFELGIQQAYEDIEKTIWQTSTRCNLRSKRNSTNNSTGNSWLWPTPPQNIGYSEIDKYAIQIYEKHFTAKNYGDITRIDAEGLPAFELLCGGFPCQSFSIAGKRGGFEDTRGTLFFDIARIIKVKRPRLIFLENVKGFLSHDEGRTFNTIILTLDELGYDLQWQVLNSKNFGVPQNRERVFIIGHLRGTPRPKVFPFRESIEKNNRGSKQRDIVRLLGFSNGEQGYAQGKSILDISGLYHTLQTQERGMDVVAINEPQYGKYEISNIAQTVKIGGDIGKCFDGVQIRRLTPTECERLQGFPDGWTEGLSDTQRYKTLGNAVTVNVIQEIANRLFQP